MGRALVALAAVLVAGAAQGTPVPHRGSARAAHVNAARRARPPRRDRRPTLAEAKAAMAALMRDKSRRRFRHNWERAVRGLILAARGRDAAAAWLEASRARYALYRWSADEADREKALILAARAAARGSREAPALAAAIRREAGEDRPVRRSVRKSAPPPRVDQAEEDSPPDPALEAVVASLSAPDPEPSRPLGSAEGEGAARVSEVRSWSSEDYTRVAVYLSRWVGWQKLELPAAPERPRRIALDLRPARLDGTALARPVPGDHVDRVRAAQNDSETVRVVLELPGADGVQVFALEDPPRLVVDVGGSAGRAEVARADAAAEDAPSSPPIPNAPPPSAPTSTSTSNATAGTIDAPDPDGDRPAPAAGAERPIDDLGETISGPVRRVVIDAGHGGHDPGAIGPRRVREKDVTLAIARRLARKLRTAGFDVVLTRRDDRYLALEERTAIANTARADLFVSIHANAHPRRNRSGVETYYLDVTGDRYAARLAARENGLDPGGEPEVARILADLDAKASAGASRRLAGLVQREVCSRVRAHVGEVRNLGVKSALFYVLLGARMPAVLVETAFVSNRAEERRLASPRYQDEVAAGIARAVSAYAPAHRIAAR